MKKSKCSFFSKEIQYLGHILSATGIRPLPAKTHAIQHMQPPTTPKQVRAFLGLVRYYRKFIKGFAKIAKPLTLLTRQQVKFEWTTVHHTAFLQLKEVIVQAPILHYPNPDKKYVVYTNALDDTCRDSHKSTMACSFSYHFCHTSSQKPNKSGRQLNRRPMASITP